MRRAECDQRRRDAVHRGPIDHARVAHHVLRPGLLGGTHAEKYRHHADGVARDGHEPAHDLHEIPTGQPRRIHHREPGAQHHENDGNLEEKVDATVVTRDGIRDGWAGGPAALGDGGGDGQDA
jgi:hypothetical protein